MRSAHFRRIAAVAGCVVAAAGIGGGGTAASLAVANDIANDAPLVTHTIPPGGSLTYESGCTYNVVLKICEPDYSTIVNRGNATETVQLREPSTGRKLAEVGVGGGGVLLSLAGAGLVLAAIPSAGRRRREETLA